jgi:hypothetical protein
MSAIALVVPVTLVAGAWLIRQIGTRVEAPRLFSLAMPLALLCVVAPVPLATLEFQAWTQLVGQGGPARSAESVRSVARALVQPLWLGSLAALATLAVAAALDTRRTHSFGVDNSSPAGRRGGPSGWLVALVPFVLVAGSACSWLAAEIGPTVVEMARELLPVVGATPTPERASAFVRQITARILLGVLGGGALSIVGVASTALVALTANHLVLTGRQERVARLTAQAAFVAVSALAVRLGVWLYGGAI